MDGTKLGADVANKVLAHYGIKGMRWGVRRTRSQIDSASEDAKTASSLRGVAKSKGTSALSNNELQQVISRMNLEQQYSRLNTGSKSRGARLVDSLLDDAQNVGRTQLRNAANDYLGNQIGKQLQKVK